VVTGKRKYSGPLFTCYCDELLRDTSLSSDARFLFVLLKSYSTKGKNGDTVYPAIRTLTRLTGWGNNRLYNAIDELDQKGLVCKISGYRKKDSKANTVNRYRLVDDFQFYGVPKPNVVTARGVPVPTVETPATVVETGGVANVETDISSITHNIQLSKQKHFFPSNDTDDGKQKAPPTPLETFQRLLGRQLNQAEIIEFCSVVGEADPVQLNVAIIKTAANKDVRHPVRYLRTCLNSGISRNHKTGELQQYGKGLYTKDRISEVFKGVPEPDREKYIIQMFEVVTVDGQTFYRQKNRPQ